MTERTKPKTQTGVVTSDKMDKTIVVRVDRLVRHAKYGKYIRRRTKLAAHDENNTASEGDIVEVAFSRPRSKTKRWRFVRVVRVGVQTEAAALAADAEVVGGGEGA